MQVSAISAVDLMCPTYHAKFAAIDNISNNHADFNRTMIQALMDLKQSYTARATALKADFLTGVSADDKIVIEDRANNAIDDFDYDFEDNKELIADFFKKPEATELKFVQDNIGSVCDDIELEMRGHLALMDYHCSKLTNRTVPISVENFWLIAVNRDALDAKTLLAVEGQMGQPAEKMYVAGVSAVYDEVRQQIKQHQEKLRNLLNAYVNGAGAAAVALTADDVIKGDWRAAQEDLKKITTFDLPEISTLKPEPFANNATTTEVAESVNEVYSNVYGELFGLIQELFVSMTILVFDLKHSAPVNA